VAVPLHGLGVIEVRLVGYGDAAPVVATVAPIAENDGAAATPAVVG